MKINTDQITQLLKEKIKSFDESIDVLEVGEVIQVGDGVAQSIWFRKCDEFGAY